MLVLHTAILLPHVIVDEDRQDASLNQVAHLIVFVVFANFGMLSFAVLHLELEFEEDQLEVHQEFVDLLNVCWIL